MTDLDHFDRFLPAELIIVTEKYLIGDVKYLSDMYGQHTIVTLDGELPMPKEVLDTAKRHFGNTDNIRKSRVTVKDGNVIFCGKKMFLTATERRILYLFLLSDKRYSDEMVTAFCLDNGKSAVPHIYNINRKARMLTGLDIIECKRYEGYHLKMI